MNAINLHAAMLALCLALGAQAASAQGESAEHDSGSSHFVAGCPVSVKNPVAGDLVATGCDVEVLAEIGGDLVALGGGLRLAAPVKGGLYAAGGHVSLEAPVAGNVRIGGGKVYLGPSATVGGNVGIGGGEVEIEGAIAGHLEVGGGTVRIDSAIGGDVEVGAGEVELGPNARIDGKLVYSGDEEIERDPAAQVRGGIERAEHNGHWTVRHQKEREHGYGYPWTHGWAWSIGLMLLAALLGAGLPHLGDALATTAHKEWGLALVIGCVMVVCVPVVALIAAVTLIGIPLAVILVALYLLLLLLGYVFAGITLGNVALGRWRADCSADNGWRIGAAALAMLSLSVLGRLPLIGAFITLAAMLTGVGLLILQTRSSPAPVSPVV